MSGFPKEDLEKEKLKEFERKVKKDRGNYTFIAERLEQLKPKNNGNGELARNRILPKNLSTFIIKKPEVIVKSSSVLNTTNK